MSFWLILLGEDENLEVSHHSLDLTTSFHEFGLPKVTELTRWQPINNVTKLILKFNNQSDISILTFMREVVPNVANELGLQYISSLYIFILF